MCRKWPWSTKARTGRSPGFSLHAQYLVLLAHFAELVICVSTTKVDSQPERQMGMRAPPAFREIRSICCALARITTQKDCMRN